jgi:hypothetical protein
LNIDQANFLFYGGSLTDSTVSDNLKKISAMQELLPLIRLLGGSLKNQVLAGSLLVSQGMLICRENREILEKMLPFDIATEMPILRSCEDYIDRYQYTRGDAGKRTELLDGEYNIEQDSNRMIYAGQNVIPGAVFYHSFVMQNVSRLEIGALYAALNDWQRLLGGTIGGSARIGHGKLATEIHVDAPNFFGDDLDLDDYESEYREYVKTNAGRIVEWLGETFPSSAREESGKPKKKTAKSAQAQKTIDDFFATVQTDHDALGGVE